MLLEQILFFQNRNGFNLGPHQLLLIITELTFLVSVLQSFSVLVQSHIASMVIFLKYKSNNLAHLPKTIQGPTLL